MTESPTKTRVAIACQGGGSHTAFTAGVLSRLLRPDVLAEYEIVAMSGTSGGAICATLAWSALVDGDPTKAESLLKGFWADNSASSVPERILNYWMLWAGQLADYVTVPAISPYLNPASSWSLDYLRSLLVKWIDFERLNRVDADTESSDRPILVLGAVEVESGVFKAFDSRRGEITSESVLASAAIPTLFRSIPVDGGLYWDGLFSQNPPVRDLLDARPDEIWVIQINPMERDGEPRTITQILDRRNELSGNLSLFQELHFIEKIDRMLEEGELRSGRFHPVGIRIIEKSRSAKSYKMGAVSKMNRDPAFLAGLIDDGTATAADFLTALDFETAWRNQDEDAVLGFLADDCVVTAEDPFPPFSATGEQAAQFVLERLARDTEIDMTRRQYASDHYLWRVRFVDQSTNEQRRGQVAIIIRNGQITRVMVGPAAPDGSIDRRVVL